MNTEEISMVQECVSYYCVKTNADNSVTITIETPKRFADLWKIKLSDLRTTMAEIIDYEPTN